jgi:hypothetical protein
MALFNNNAEMVTWYIPASVLKRANVAEKGFKISYNDMDITLSPRMINETVNDAIFQMDRNIRDKYISDYFIRLTIQRTNHNDIIEGNPTLSKETEISVEAVGTARDMSGDLTAWDRRVFMQVEKQVRERINDPGLRQSIENRIRNDINNESMMDYLDGLALTVRNEIMAIIRNELRPGNGNNGILSRDIMPVEEFDSPLLLTAKKLGEHTVVNGYSNERGFWVNIPVADHFNGKTMSVRKPGTYVFTGREVNIPGIENVPRGGNISAFTAKYGLEDFLGYDGVDLNQNATRHMVAGCVARMAGAPKDADPINWINANLNVSLSSRNENGLVQKQEAAAMVMALYEKKTGTAIKSLTIRNYQSTARMVGLDDRYAQAVRASFELGMLTDTGMRPADSVTIRELLDMLAALDGKVKL